MWYHIVQRFRKLPIIQNLSFVSRPTVLGPKVKTIQDKVVPEIDSQSGTVTVP